MLIDFWGSFDESRQNIFKVFNKKFENDLPPEEDNLEIDYLYEGVRKSAISEEDLFTNFIGKKTDENLKKSLVHFHQNHHSIGKREIEQVRLNKDIEARISIYFDLNEDDRDSIFKAKATTMLDDYSEARIFLTVDKRLSESKYKINIILVDPFHLVIPSEHNGDPKEIAQQKTFDENKCNRQCLSNLLTDIF